MPTVSGASTGFKGESGDFSWDGSNYSGGLANVYRWQLVGAAHAIDATIFNPPGGFSDFVPGLSTYTGTIHAWVAPGQLPPLQGCIGSGVFYTHGVGFPNSGSAAQGFSGVFGVTRATIDTRASNGLVGYQCEVQSKGQVFPFNGS